MQMVFLNAVKMYLQLPENVGPNRTD